MLGIIVEDASDGDVLKALAKKIAKRQFAIRQVKADGCGRMVAKCGAWAASLREQGCTLLAVVRDLDDGNLEKVRSSLAASLRPCPIHHHIVVIAVREIEAWLLADHTAVTRGLRLRRALGKQANPEAIVNPKSRLGEVIYERSQGTRRYLNTVDNKKIAAFLTIGNVRRCASFRPFEEFVRIHLG